MLNSLSTNIAVLLAVTGFCEARCRFTDQFTPVNVDLAELVKRDFRVGYESAPNVTHDIRNAYKSGDNASERSESSEIDAEYKNGVMHVTSTYASGRTVTINTYVLAKSNEGAYLMYSCSDSGIMPDDVDLRFIIVPIGTTLSDEGTNHLLAADKKFNFHPDLSKVPNSS